MIMMTKKEPTPAGVEMRKYYDPTITAKKGIGYAIVFLLLDVFIDIIPHLEDPFLKSSLGAVIVAALVSGKNYIKNKDLGK